jgi:hypothetical protein
MRDDHNIYRRQVLDRKWNRYIPETIKLECLDLSQVSEWSRYHYHGSPQHTSRLYNTTQENSTLHKFLENWGSVHGVIPVSTTDINHTIISLMIITRYFIYVVASFCCWYMRFQGLGLLPFWTNISRRGATVRPHYTHSWFHHQSQERHGQHLAVEIAVI